MSIFKSLEFLTPALLLAACTDAATTAGDEVASEDAQEATQLTWKRVENPNARATSIGVSPDNTIWVVNAPVPPATFNTDRTITYMRVVDIPGTLFSEEQWIETNGKARTVTVDNGGEPEAVTNAGRVLFNEMTLTNGIYTPSRNWHIAQEKRGATTCVKDIGVVHLENYMVFHTGDDGANHSYYALHCQTGAFLFMNEATRDEDGDASTIFDWVPATQSGKQLAFFSFPQLADQSVGKIPWVLDASGNMFQNIPGTTRFTAQKTTPTLATSLTDHYALAADGVYEWSDSRATWTRVIENTTPTGTITQIARSGRIAIRAANGSFVTVGPSALWAIDNSKNIYYATAPAVIR